MGTNFYWIVKDSVLPTGKEVPFDRDHPDIHIGKRSAAGYYCWDCDLTLCVGGEHAIHKRQSEWYERCPGCGQEPVREGWDSSTVGIELGFADPRPRRPTGIRTACTFSWAQEGWKVYKICEENPDKELIEDEYGRRYTGRQFLEMLEANCPIQFIVSIGQWFS